MPCFLVRLIGNHDLVVIFSAPDLGTLYNLVDECIEPEDCEFKLIPPGGICWDSRAVPVPLPDISDEERAPIPWQRASFTDAWLYAVWDDDAPWIALFHIANDR
jgi:hypothetical protein